ncbi:hypothetical protein L618_000200001190 [Rhodococcus rhodochrous J45]|uniref:Uncharacterized protein n=1 Tax=Rhodococcus rhodochrous J45 TaxID=935266 RepID=A0A562E5T9_RHORH|nr:hypothetical protein [Rhodococcus rhodochrous]TWH17038.1 hypothetical protein L618_000200001190 [Rhodococcus rhodochrous J45]
MKVGERLKSPVCGAEVVVVRIDGTVTGPLLCGGEPMSADAAPAAGAATGQGLLIGKRYEGGGVEVLCVRPGTGPLAIGDAVLAEKQARPLPSSD